jgi:phosphoesterase RecJ-like protein
MDRCAQSRKSKDRDEVAQSSVQVIVPNAFPAFFNWMPGADKILVYEKNQMKCNEIIAKADLFICTDFNDPKRIGPMGEKMLANPCPKILIDHHLLDRDKVAQRQKTADAQGQKEWYDEEHVDSAASSACEIVYRLITNSKLRITNEIATCIYTGLMTDTGNFSYNSTNAELYDIIASLLRAGVEKDKIYDAVFNQYSSDRMRLIGYALHRKMRIFPEHHLALITLTADELDRYHHQPGDCEGLVNMPLQIGDVYYSVFMREERAKPGTPKSRIRISFRSQGDRPVNILAHDIFNGGGHMNAAGGESFGTLDNTVKTFEDHFRDYFNK